MQNIINSIYSSAYSIYTSFFENTIISNSLFTIFDYIILLRINAKNNQNRLITYYFNQNIEPHITVSNVYYISKTFETFIPLKNEIKNIAFDNSTQDHLLMLWDLFLKINTNQHLDDEDIFEIHYHYNNKKYRCQYPISLLKIKQTIDENINIPSFPPYSKDDIDAYNNTPGFKNGVLLATDDRNNDLTTIITEYSGPLNNFYNNTLAKIIPKYLLSPEYCPLFENNYLTSFTITDKFGNDYIITQNTPDIILANNFT